MTELQRVQISLATIVPEGEFEVILGHDTSLALKAEKALTGSMVPTRANEFLTGRTCARSCLRRLGIADAPLVIAEQRYPLWPEGVVGSISHTEGICLAVVLRSSSFWGLGVDVERREAVEVELEEIVASSSERERFRGLDDWRTRLFSAKEAVFKGVNPVTAVWLDFHDVEVLELGDNFFRAVVRKNELGWLFDGDQLSVGAYVFSILMIDHAWASQAGLDV